MSAQWFHNWFNSPYYHILYNQRDETEAKILIDNLLATIHLPQEAQLLDIACGRGRYATLLHQAGYNVTGIDLSLANIQYANRFQQAGLRFFVHDMRALHYNNYFDAAFNLFTSFGYFDTDEQHLQALHAFNRSLKCGGILVLDYLNSYKVQQGIQAKETKVIENITFQIRKAVEGNRIVKDITFEHNGTPYEFQESVCLFNYADFERMFAQSGFNILNCFGNYNLDAFDLETSDRLIFICTKTNA